MPKSKIKKWDAIHGTADDEDQDGWITEEIPGYGPVISRVPIKTVEDMVEQNDNNLDGVINNVEPVIPPAPDPEEKKSVRDLLREQSYGPWPKEERKVTPCLPERELM